MVGVQIGLIDVAASGTCPARKIPSFALFYVSAPDFTGADLFQIEIEEGNNKKAQVSYQITVHARENKQ